MGDMSIAPRQMDFHNLLTPVAWPKPVRPALPASRPAPARTARQRRGAVAHQSGQMAEDAALRAYSDRGARLLARRYRVREGEIDLILDMDGILVFAEVKSRRTIEEAAHAIDARQWQRLEQAANRYMMEANVGAATDIRFDAVLMDRAGRMEVVENAHLF